jgi:hypothetical protein
MQQQGITNISDQEFRDRVRASAPKRSYKAIVEQMLENGPVQITCDDKKDVLTVQVALHATYRRYVPDGTKLKTRTDGNVVYASLFELAA